MTTAQRATANRMIAAKGQAVTLTRRASGAYDPATGTATITTSTQLGKGVILPLAGYRKIGAGNIVAGDETLLLSALDTSGAALDPLPTVDDELTDANGKVYALTVVDALHPDGTGILYDCVIRGTA